MFFAIGAVNPFFVETFSGFDRDAFAQRVRLLGDGGTGPNEVLQSSGIPFLSASITAFVSEATDLALLLSYDLSKAEVPFSDGRGWVTPVRILDLSVEDLTDWWTIGATLIATGPTRPTVTPEVASLHLTTFAPSVH